MSIRKIKVDARLKKYYATCFADDTLPNLLVEKDAGIFFLYDAATRQILASAETREEISKMRELA